MFATRQNDFFTLHVQGSFRTGSKDGVRQQTSRRVFDPLHYRPQRSCGKVMFSQTSVILFTEGACVVGVRGRGHAWQGGHAWQVGHVWQGACMAGDVHGRGACMAGEGGMHAGGAYMAGGVHGRGHAWQGGCMAGGMHGRGTHAWKGGHVWKGACAGSGACMAGGMCGRGHVWQGGHAWHERWPLKQICTHPTGMHSC